LEKIQDKVGESQQLLAKQCCEENLQKEVEATKASGILPLVDGRVPITCSGDTGWQGNGSRCTYNSQSGQTMLCGGITKKVVAFQCFQNYVVPAKTMRKKIQKNYYPHQYIDVRETGRNLVNQWSHMGQSNVQNRSGTRA